jgi:NADH-quinone oxidoreductase subunit L
MGAVLAPLFALIHPKVRDWMGVVFIGGGMAAAISLIPDADINKAFPIKWLPVGYEGGELQYLQNSILVDPLSVYMAVIAAGLGFIIAMFSVGYMDKDEAGTRYWFFFQFFVGGMVLLVMAGDLIFLYAGWEIVGLCSFALIAHWYHRPDPQGELCAKSGIKAFIMTRIGDVGLLAAIIALYLYTDTISIYELKYAGGGLFGKVPSNMRFWVGLGVFLGAMGKSAQFPFHTWISSPDTIDIDAMQGPTTVSALIHAATMVKAGVYLIARFFPIFLQVDVENLFTVIGYIGGITALITALAAVVSTDIKRVLAYSTLSQLGYMFLAFGAATHLGLMAGQFHIVMHAIFKALLFLMAGAIIHSIGVRDMREMGGLKDDFKVEWAVCLIGCAALAGVFPLGGAISKEFIFHALIHEDKWPFFILAVVTAFITAVYSFRLFFLVFYGKKSVEKVHRPSTVMRIPLVILGGLTLIAGALYFYLFDYFDDPFVTRDEFAIEDELPTVAFSLAIVLAGIFLAWKVYGDGKRTVAITNPTLLKLQKFLYEGYYIDHLYYKLTSGGTKTSYGASVIHTGKLNYNMIGCSLVLGFAFFYLIVWGNVV